MPRATNVLAAAFLRRVLAASPWQAPKKLTDSGTHFGNTPRQVYAWRHIFDRIGDEHAIGLRFPKSARPWTNRQVERVNRPLKQATGRHYRQQTTNELNQYRKAFLLACHLGECSGDYWTKPPNLSVDDGSSSQLPLPVVPPSSP